MINQSVFNWFCEWLNIIKLNSMAPANNALYIGPHTLNKSIIYYFEFKKIMRLIDKKEIKTHIHISKNAHIPL